MDTSAVRRLTLVAGFAWLVVAGSRIRSAIVDEGDDWELSYLIFSSALVVAAVASLAVAMLATRTSGRPRLRMAGLVVGGLGCASALVGAWALPLWMTLLGAGFTLVAVSSGPGGGRRVAVLAAGQLVGLASLLAGLVAEVGRRDEWGDHPAAGAIGIGVVVAITLVALAGLSRMPRDTTQGAAPVRAG